LRALSSAFRRKEQRASLLDPLGAALPRFTERRAGVALSIGQGRPLPRKESGSAALTEHEGEEQPDEEHALP
jgi:hypothetical protein